jgi:hypothetical protein
VNRGFHVYGLSYTNKKNASGIQANRRSSIKIKGTLTKGSITGWDEKARKVERYVDC